MSQTSVSENKESFGDLAGGIHVIFWKRTWLPSCPENLRETEFKAKELLCLVESIRGWDNVQAVPWLLLTALTQVYSDKQ